MTGRLKIWRKDDMDASVIEDFVSRFQECKTLHILVSDGIMLDARSLVAPQSMEKVRIQRILTPYQLERILMESDNEPHLVLIKSEVIDSWSVHVMESLYDIMRIKSSFYGCIIETAVIGEHGIYESYFGGKFYNPVEPDAEREGLFAWEEAPLP
ncbi:MAG: hypothetical protein M1533_04610 [Candidatus Thermoplasmatota archaeon]|jgi:hypothetical protein|nr:hypothetical protein [Candidatus Thermoplasmatota archaeon]MCL5794116.1 hypothetical protein [Candidatus Thermoplasmatota archaeon]